MTRHEIALEKLHGGTVIPAHPLALDENRQFDEKRQRAVVRYYLDSGVGGLAVAVHTTQFEIRLPQYNLLERVLLRSRQLRRLSLQSRSATMPSFSAPADLTILPRTR